MFLVIMSKIIRSILLLCLAVSCNRAQNPSLELTLADSTKYSDTHNLYAGKLTGTWYRNSLGARATLLFEPISPERVRFSITALSGAHTGEIDGFLTIEGTRASFRTESEEYGNCVLLFDGSVEGSIRIEQEGCSSYGGVGVMFLGLYDRIWSSDEVLALAALEERYGVDVTREIHMKAGLDFDLFAASLHLENSIAEDGDFSEVNEYYVRGQYGYLSSCVAVNSQTGEIWIAYVKDKKLMYTGSLDRAPIGFQKWLHKISDSHGLEMTRKPESI